MDLSSFTDSGMSDNEQQPAFEYTAQAVSQIINGEVKITIADNAFTMTALFNTVEIAFAEINSLSFANHIITVKTDSGDYTFSYMGQWAQPFYNELCDAYNNAVLRSMFIKNNPVLTTKGDYRYSEKDIKGSGYAAVHVYENNVTALPPDLTARRVPLCFVTGMDKSDYNLTLKLDTGESYSYAKLGYDTSPFATAVEKQIRALFEKTLAAIKEIDPSLTTVQASQLVKIMPQGAAAMLEQLTGIASSFKTALEEKIENTRAAEYYTEFKKMCEPAKIYIGFRKNEAGADSGGMADIIGGLTGGNDPIEALDDNEAETAQPDLYLLWLIVPSPNGQYAAVEFAEADSATFVYKTGGDFDGFAKQLNRALEAINFKREVIRMTDEELKKPENADYYMAAKRTASLQFVRSNFVGRVIHSSPEAWKRKLTEMWSGTPTVTVESVPIQTNNKFCEKCGELLRPGMRFCNNCGTKI